MKTAKTVTGFLCLLPALIVAGCSAPTEPQFSQAEANAIRQRTQEYRTTFNAKDAEKVASYYTGESVLLPPNAPTLRGKDPIKTFYVDLYEQGAQDLEIETRDVRGHGTLAYEAGTYSLIRRPAAGESTRDRGKYLFIWRNTNGTWLIEYSGWNSDLDKAVTIAN